jgi:hypothetical protein
MNTKLDKKEDDSFDKELSLLLTTSSKIRFLNSKGLSRSQIKDKLHIRYQHVRNVLITPIKKEKV